MSRSVPEWYAKHDDEAIPPRVRLRVFMRFNGVCPKCDRPLRPKHWACDHIVALANGGQHCESNLQPLCNSPCHSDKSRADVAIKSKNYRVQAKTVGIRPRPRLRSRGFDRAPAQRSATRPLERRP